MATNIHNYTVQESTNIGLGQSGGVTISDTNTHYGRFVAISAIEDTVFASLTEEGNYCNGIGFDTGIEEISVGHIIEGATSGAMAVVLEVSVSSGSWADDDAAGYIIFSPVGTGDVLFDSAEDINIIDQNYSTITSSAAVVVANGATDGSTNLNSKTLKAGATIYGQFTKIDLTSGTVRAYKG